MRKSREINMTKGPLFLKIWAFTLPIIAAGLLQLLYNATDMVVVGNAVGEVALAAVGSTSSMTSLLVNFFMGLSIGSNVLISRLFGAGDKEGVRSAVHTAMPLSVISGLIVGIVGFIFCKPLLIIMGTPENVLSDAILYARIYFCGVPAMSVYNFGAAILRSSGDSKRPMFFLAFSGLINVSLNLVFVLVFGMGVDGVAWATSISQVVSAYLVVRSLIKADNELKLEFKNLRLDRKHIGYIIKIGLPAGVQGAIFSLSNMLIQSSVNSFGSVYMAGNTAAHNLDSFSYTALNSFSQAAVTFTSKNIGAGKLERVKLVVKNCIISVVSIGVITGILFNLFGKNLLGLYNSDTAVIEAGMIRLIIMTSFQFICGTMDSLSGTLRGMGKSLVPTIVSLIGVCGFRVLWIYTVFRAIPEFWIIFILYPISWFVTGLALLITLIIVYKKLKRKETILI
jgi:putative MATE family efflux protein